MKHVPDEKQIEGLLKDLSPSFTGRLDEHLAGAPWMLPSTEQGERMNTIQPRRIPRVAFATAVVVALLSFAFITPQGRALTQSILQFFTRAESNIFPLQPSQIPAVDPSAPTAAPPAPLISMTEAESQAGFDAAELPLVPEGFNYLGARLYGNAINIEYEAQGGGGHLMITQSQEGFLQSDWDRVPAEAVVPVKIGDQDAEFAQGTFVVPAGESSALWNPSAPILRLRWVKDGIWFEMAKFGDVERIKYLDMNAMIRFAEGLTTDPFPLEASDAEAQAGFDVLEPLALPTGMTFLGSSLDPVLGMVSLSFGYSENDRRLLINQQPADSQQTCELCGLVGASASVEPVQIGEMPGEYALGVWELTENGAVWRDDPYLKTIRWQNNGIAYEIIYMGMDVEREELIAIAEGLR